MYEKIILILEKVEHILWYVKLQETSEPTNENELWAWLSKDEVMEHLRISQSTYYAWIKKGYLKPCSKIGEDRFSVHQINHFVTKRGNRKRTDFNVDQKDT